MSRSRRCARGSLFFLAAIFSISGCKDGSSRSEASQVSITISPSLASITTAQTVSFDASASGIKAGQSSLVTWSAQEPRGGNVNSSGRYTPASTGTFHVVATSIAHTSKQTSAVVTVGARGVISVFILPTGLVMAPGASFKFRRERPSAALNVP